MNMRPGAGLEGEGEGVAQAEGPDGAVVAGGLVEERVVGGDRAVRVDAQDLAEEVGQRLGVGAVGVLADGDVELAVGAEVQGAAVVVGGAAEVVEVEEDGLAAGHGHVAVGGEAADAVVDGGRGGGVVDVDEVVGREVGVEGHAQQAPFAGRVDGHGQERRRQQRAVLDDPQLPALLADEQAAVGAKAMAVGLDRPLATSVSVKPVGRVAAFAGDTAAASVNVIETATGTRTRVRARQPRGMVFILEPGERRTRLGRHGPFTRTPA